MFKTNSYFITLLILNRILGQFWWKKKKKHEKNNSESHDTEYSFENY